MSTVQIVNKDAQAKEFEAIENGTVCATCGLDFTKPDKHSRHAILGSLELPNGRKICGDCCDDIYERLDEPPE